MGEAHTWDTVPEGAYVPGSGEIVSKVRAPFAGTWDVTFRRREDEPRVEVWHAIRVGRDKVPTVQGPLGPV